MSFFGLFKREPVAATPSAEPVLIPSPTISVAVGTRVLRVGVPSGQDVAWLQRRLGIRPDGIYGPLTRGAVEAWQAENDLVVDGVVGPSTWRKLGLTAPSAPSVFREVPQPTQGSDLARLEEAIRGALVAEKATDPAGWAPILAREMLANNMTTAVDVACALGNFIHETGGLRLLVENLHYTKPEQLVANWPGRFPTIEVARPYLRNAPLLAEKVYFGRMGNTHPGDGFLMRGRGLIQVTGRAAYEQLAADLDIPIEALIVMMESREGAAKTACRWWRLNGISRIAINEGPRAVRRRVNGGTIGFEDAVETSERILPRVAALS